MAALSACLALAGLPAQVQAQAGAPDHYSPKGKAPSKFTVEAQELQRKILPFADKQDFEEAKQGLLAVPASKVIKNAEGGVVWDIGRWDFLLQGKDFNSIHPSLQRQAILNMNYGLYEVVPGRIYQVRGFDLANISFIKGDTGWIVFDPLTSSETARAALDLINEKVGKRPVVAVVISHTHGDHFGGTRGVVDEADVRSGKVPLITPHNFMYEAISENLYAGNAMIRRKSYTYGDVLPANPYGHVDSSIGKFVSAGSLGIIAPSKEITQPIEEMTIDGVKMVFQNTPGSEAPAEMNTWFPQFKAFWAAENITATQHNILTLRGAPVRDALAWSKYINLAIYKFGEQADVMFASHTWPRWGKERILQVMRGQRDMYANLNNQVLHLANSGVTINQIHNVYAPPKALADLWFARGYHGSYEHNSRAVIQRYLGFWDLNPTTLDALSPEDSAPMFVEMMGGSARILAKGKELYDQGRYRMAQEMVNKVVLAQASNQPARDLLADIFEQQGYQYESPSLRNSFLSAAKELRDGVIPVKAANTAGADFVRGTTTELFLEFLAIRVDSRKAGGLKFKINLSTPDNGEKFVVEMSNATLTSITGYQAADADLTITINRSDLEQFMLGRATLVALAQAGKAKLVGNPAVWQQLAGTLGAFDPWFEVFPGPKTTAASASKPLTDPFAERPRARSGTE
ncbi:MAG: MBL fold metallo-hydrolase [Ideonella sp.]|nr:MBL fold metallo-hydrolase [Ideonella sp.]